MQLSIRTPITRWARASNRRRIAEELIIALTWVGISLVVGAGLIRACELIIALGWASSDTWPSKTAQWAFTIWATGWVAKIAVTRGIWRYRKRRTRPRDFARFLDRRHRTHDLFETAMAVESSHAVGAEGLRSAILTRARERLAALSHPVVEPFREPQRTIAGIGLAAALVGLLPASAPGASVEPDHPQTEATQPIDVRAARMVEHAEWLSGFGRGPSLAPDARLLIGHAEQQLRTIGASRGHGLSQLTKAERALRSLRTRLHSGGLLDPVGLQAANTSTLMHELADALAHEHTDAAQPLAAELLQRLDTVDVEELASAAGLALGGPTRLEPGRLDRVLEQLQNRNVGAASVELHALSEDLAARPSPTSLSQTVEDALADLHDYRIERLAHANRPLPEHNDPVAPADGSIGRSTPSSERSSSDGRSSESRRSHGGDAGVSRIDRDTRRNPAESTVFASEQVPIPLDAIPSAEVRLVQRAEQGQRDSKDYQARYEHYRTVAESAMRSEEIPVTRRDYVRRYFQAIGGQAVGGRTP